MKYDRYLSLFLVLFSFQFSPALADYGEVNTEKGRPQRRTIHFPEGEVVGALSLVPEKRTKGVRYNQTTVTAKGTVVITVPPGYLVAWEPNGRVYKDAHYMSQVDAKQIECLKLKMVSMEESGSVTDLALAYIGGFQNLVSLDLSRSDVTDAGLAYVRDLPKLKYFIALHTQIQGRPLDLKTLPALLTFDVSHSAFEENSLKSLPEHNHLILLGLANTRLTKKGVTYISRCEHLQNLDISDNPLLGNDCIDSLLTLRKLETLSLRGTSIGGLGLARLKALPTLQLLLLPASVQSQDDFSQLKRLMPNCTMRTFEAKPINREANDLFKPLSR